MNNRITGEGEAAPDDLLAHPENWRVHPDKQRDAMQGALDEVGWVQNVVVNERTGRIIDGHLRVEIARQRGENVPVVYVDLEENEERVVLASLDTITGLAERDNATFLELLKGVEIENDGLAAFIDSTREDVQNAYDKENFDPNSFGAGSEDDQGKLDEKAKHTCPNCGHEF